MYVNTYALEVMAKDRLADLRAAAAREVLIASLRAPRGSLWAALRAMLRRDGAQETVRKIVSPRHA